MKEGEVAPEEWIATLLQRACKAGLPLLSRDARLDDTGWSSRVVHAADREGRPWILRAARDPRTARSFVVEHAALRRVVLPGVEVPQWRLLDIGLVAYPLLNGAPAAVEDPDTLLFRWSVTSRDRHRYAQDLARAITRLHAIEPPPEVRVVDPTEARAAAIALLAAGECQDLPALWRPALTAWVNDDACWKWSSRLLHGDLHPGHTLLSAGKLTAIIDWTDTVADDPARDFVYLAWADEASEPILGTMIAAYAAEANDRGCDFARRVAGYADLMVVELLSRGRRNGSQSLTGAASRRLQLPPRLAGRA